MNIEITQDNSRTEQLGSNGAQVIRKMYQLATDENNTVFYSGYIKSNSGYGDQIEYLNDRFGPELKVEANVHYMQFEDPVMKEVIFNKFGITSVGITKDYFNTTVTIQSSDFTSEQLNSLVTTRDLNKFTVKPKLNSISSSSLQNLWINPDVSYADQSFMFGDCPNVQNRIYCFLKSGPAAISFRNSFANPVDIYIIRSTDRNHTLTTLSGYQFAGNIKIDMIYCKYTTGFYTGYTFNTIDKLVLDNSTVVPVTVQSGYEDSKFNKIYVPDDLLAQYQTDWASQGASQTLIGKLHNISELQEVSLSDYNVEDMFDIPLNVQSQLVGKLITEYRQLS